MEKNLSQSQDEESDFQLMMNNIALPVFNIERFALHDGLGIRTVLFLKGCPLHCPWCANPESQSAKPLLRYQKEKCAGCRRCEAVCPHQAVLLDPENQHYLVNRNLCTGCGKCADVCLNQARSISGQTMTLNEIFHEVLKDEAYYQATGGGLTLSGGEATLHAQSLIPLLKALKKKRFRLPSKPAVLLILKILSCFFLILTSGCLILKAWIPNPSRKPRVEILDRFWKL